MPQKLTTAACFIQEESSGGKQFRKYVSCFLCSRRKRGGVVKISIFTHNCWLQICGQDVSSTDDKRQIIILSYAGDRQQSNKYRLKEVSCTDRKAVQISIFKCYIMFTFYNAHFLIKNG